MCNNFGGVFFPPHTDLRDLARGERLLSWDTRLTRRGSHIFGQRHAQLGGASRIHVHPARNPAHRYLDKCTRRDRAAGCAPGNRRCRSDAASARCCCVPDNLRRPRARCRDAVSDQVLHFHLPRIIQRLWVCSCAAALLSLHRSLVTKCSRWQRSCGTCRKQSDFALELNFTNNCSNSARQLICRRQTICPARPIVCASRWERVRLN